MILAEPGRCWFMIQGGSSRSRGDQPGGSWEKQYETTAINDGIYGHHFPGYYGHYKGWEMDVYGHHFPGYFLGSPKSYGWTGNPFILFGSLLPEVMPRCPARQFGSAIGFGLGGPVAGCGCRMSGNSGA